MSELQKALILEQVKSPLRLDTIPIPKPDSGEVLVKIMACGLNLVDLGVQMQGIIPNVEYPTILGVDIAGEVVEVGNGVQGYVKGDRITFLGNYSKKCGGLQQYAVGPVDTLVKIPAHMSYAEASSILLTFYTAAIPLLAANPVGAGLNPTLDSKVSFSGEPALVIGGGSCVGQFAIQIYKSLGFSTIITYASSKHTEYLKSIGATHVIDRTEVPLLTLPDAVKGITSSPVKNIYVAIAQSPDSAETGYRILAHGGQMAIAHPAPVKPEDADATGRKVYGVWTDPHKEPNVAIGNEIRKTLPRWLQEGVIKPTRVEILPNGLASVSDALPRFMTGGVSGVKLVVNPQEMP